MTEFHVARVASADDRLRTLTYPRYANLLTEAALADSDLLAVAAWVRDQPVGLALSLRDPVEGSGRLMSLAVAAPWRRRGFGLALLAAAEDGARQRGWSALCALHGEGLRGRDAWLALLARAGWGAPELGLLALTGLATWASEARTEWDALFVRLAEAGFSVTPWHDVSAADRAALDRLDGDAGRMSHRWGDAPLPEVSVVVREHGRPVGWVLGTHGTRTGDIYYPVGWVVPRLQRMGWLVAALVEACLAQERAFGDGGTCSFQTAGDNRAMRDFMLRRLDKWTIRLDRHWLNTKDLRS